MLNTAQPVADVASQTGFLRDAGSSIFDKMSSYEASRANFSGGGKDAVQDLVKGLLSNSVPQEFSVIDFSGDKLGFDFNIDSQIAMLKATGEHVRFMSLLTAGIAAASKAATQFLNQA